MEWTVGRTYIIFGCAVRWEGWTIQAELEPVPEPPLGRAARRWWPLAAALLVRREEEAEAAAAAAARARAERLCRRIAAQMRCAVCTLTHHPHWC